MKSDISKKIICVVGLGYVGLPMVEAFSRRFHVIGLDIKKEKVAELSRKNTCENIFFTSDVKEIAKADMVVICVPTPVAQSKEPDLSYVEKAAEIVGRNIKKGTIVTLESTVYPGVTEEIVKPILERESGFVCGKDFKVAYCPERVNPGDKEHTIEKIGRIVAGMDKETTDIVAEYYGSVIPNIFKAKDIRTAEAAKVIENIQRDLNLALINELSLIFDRLNLSTQDVLDAASTKWNFQRYTPGLVGGHCIPVDPYYLVHRAREAGYNPQVILAGRSINDYMAKHVAEMTIKALNNVSKVIKGSRILIMGLTYKENVADTRETPVKRVIKELQEYGVEVFGYDPILDDREEDFGVKILDNLEQEGKFDGIILAVPHDVFKDGDQGISLDKLKAAMNDKPVLVDVKAYFHGNGAVAEKGIYYRTL